MYFSGASKFILKLFKYFLFLFIVLINNIFGQNKISPTYAFPDSFYYLKNIVIQGNRSTKSFVITRELTIFTNSLITHQDLNYNSERIYSLGIFTKVELLIEQTNSDSLLPTADLHINVVERLNYLVYPIFGFRDKETDKLFYGVGFAHINFREQKENLFFEVVRGYDPTIFIFHNIPYLNSDDNIFGNYKIASSDLYNRSKKFEGDSIKFKTNLFNATIGKRFSVYTRSSILFGWKQIKLNYNIPDLLSSTDFNDKVFTTIIEFNYDSRNLIEYPSSGSFQKYQLHQYYNLDVSTNYFRYLIDSRFYKQILGDNILTAKIFINVAQNKFIPIYDHQYFGYQDRLQGHYFNVLEGENLSSFATELHYPIIKPKYFYFADIPFEEFRDIRFATYLSFFANTSAAWWGKDKISKTFFYTGYGAGLHFLLPYSLVVRTEYGFGNRGLTKGNFYWDIGAAF